MTEPARCRGCKRRLKRPSPSGFGPVCFRRLYGEMAARGYTGLDHGPAPFVDGQLAFDDWELRPLPSPDLRDQKASDRELWAATTVPVLGRYL